MLANIIRQCNIIAKCWNLLLFLYLITITKQIKLFQNYILGTAKLAFNAIYRSCGAGTNCSAYDR